MYELCDKAKNFAPYDPIEGDYRVRLDANESFLMPTVADRRLMAQAAEETAFNRYPDPLATAPRRAFADLYGVDERLVTVGNGSDELISVILSAFLQKGETVLTAAPDFSMYRFYTSITENPCITLEKDAALQLDADAVLAAIERHHARLVVFSNPCNPTGQGLTREQVRRILTADALIVLDEAYMDFWDQSLLPEVAEYDNLIILRTASKALGLAALRLGFAVANERLTAVLRAAKAPYNVNALSQAVGEIVLRNPVYREVCLELILQSKKELTQSLLRLERHGLLKVYESHTNFVLVESELAPLAHQRLLECSIAVRLIGERYLRITAGTQAENRETAAALGAILAHEKGVELTCEHQA